MPQETKAKFETGNGTGAPAGVAASLQGWSADAGDPATTMDVLEKAFDFRGDVTLLLDDGRTVAGYIFDRRRGRALDDSTVRLMGAASDEKILVKYSQIRRVDFGKDTAAGKSFETWIKKYVDKKLKGERASIESESLD